MLLYIHCKSPLRESGVDPDLYEWSDGSDWDYAIDTYSYPFSPGNNPFLAGCVALWSEDDYLLRNGLCVDKRQVLCNTPGSTMEPTTDTADSTTTTEEGESEKKSSKEMTLASLIIAVVLAVAAIILLLWIIVNEQKGGADGDHESKYSDLSLIQIGRCRRTN